MAEVAAGVLLDVFAGEPGAGAVGVGVAEDVGGGGGGEKGGEDEEEVSELHGGRLDESWKGGKLESWKGDAGKLC